MIDLKNMPALAKQRRTDKAITQALSILGALVGAGCVVFAVTVVFN